MSFIIKENNIVINARLTTIGRKLLASGNLNFNKWMLGDSEINYTFVDDTGFDTSEFNILRPKDKSQNIVYPILPVTTATDGFNTLSTITPIETIVKNTAKERGFFSGSTASGFTTNISSAYTVQKNLMVTLSGVTGGTTLSIKQDSGFSFLSEPAIGDLLKVEWINPSFTGATSTGGTINSGYTIPHLFYQIQSFTGTISGNTLVVTVDRTVPNFSGSGTTKNAKCLIYPGGDAINNYYGSNIATEYWNDNTLAFNSNCNIATDDVPVWNMNIVFTEDLAGKQSGYETISGFGSSGYTGFKSYINKLPTQKSLAVLHYTNNSISNYYGEQFYNGTSVIELPTIIWSKTSNKTGCTLKCLSATTVNILTGLETPYYDLYVDDSYNTVVGKCFPNLKLVIIEDEELVAALSYKSNRNWTYPSMINEGNSLGSTLKPNVFTTTTQRLYVTYLFENTTGYTSNKSYGYTTPLHCQNYVIYSAETSNGTLLTNNQVPRFSIDSDGLQYLSDVTGFNTGNGLTFNKFKLLYQLVNSTTTRPNPALWYEYDYTSQLNGYSTWSGSTSIPSTAFSNTVFELNNNIITGGTLYNLNNYITIPLTSEPTKLQFGDESFLYGNLKTDIAATVFKTKFTMMLAHNQFNTSANPTWDSSSSSVYFSEVGIYDNSSTPNLVAIGKLNYPIEKKNNQSRIIELSIDF